MVSDEEQPLPPDYKELFKKYLQVRGIVNIVNDVVNECSVSERFSDQEFRTLVRLVEEVKHESGFRR
jgi:hypothetical protein